MARIIKVTSCEDCPFFELIRKPTNVYEYEPFSCRFGGYRVIRRCNLLDRNEPYYDSCTLMHEQEYIRNAVSDNERYIRSLLTPSKKRKK